MSAREWKPGDVAHLSLVDGTTAIGVRNVRNDGWHHSGTWGGSSAYDKIGGHVACPLAVIDPEDREQVERLTELLWRAHGTWGHMKHRLTEVAKVNQAALRGFADPTPPKPEEPLGLGAVAKDDRGRLWVRVDMDDMPWRSHDDQGCWANYSDIVAVRVLSSGVEPLAGWECELLERDS